MCTHVCVCIDGESWLCSIPCRVMDPCLKLMTSKSLQKTSSIVEFLGSFFGGRGWCTFLMDHTERGESGGVLWRETGREGKFLRLRRDASRAGAFLYG